MGNRTAYADRFEPGSRWPLVLVAAISVSACGPRGGRLEPNLNLPDAFVELEPNQREVSKLESISMDYEQQTSSISGKDLHDLTLQRCLVLAVRHNRQLRRATHTTERIGLERTIARRQLDQPELIADYSVEAGPNNGDGRVSTIGRWGGFEIEPFVRYFYDEASDDDHSTSYGVAVSRQLFRIDYEQLRQHLPLTRATRDFHLAINNRILELRRLHLSVVESFYEIHRLTMRVEVRKNRVADAKQFLKAMEEKVRTGFSAPVEVTNAKINLNQARTDLVRDETNLKNAKDSLLDLLGAAIQLELTLDEDASITDESVDIDLDGDLTLVLQHHEQVRNQMLTMEMQRQKLLISRDELWPDLSATFTTSRDANGDGNAESLGLQLTMPLDGYRAERARATQDRLQLMELKVDLAAIRSDLETRLRREFRNTTRFQTTVRLAVERLESENRKLDATIKRYEAGTLDNLEVTRAKEAVDRAQVDLLDARINHILAEARYRSILPAPPEE